MEQETKIISVLKRLALENKGIFFSSLMGKLTPTELMLFGLFCSKCGLNDGRDFRYTMDNIIKDTNYKKSTIEKAIKGLVQKGLLKKYRINNLCSEQYYNVNINEVINII